MDLQPIPFWFLRHGETDWNAQGLSQGSTDIPLNAVGLIQARRAAATIAGLGIASIVASPLSRAKDTARIAAEALGAQEGLPMGDWSDDWIAGDWTPEGAETFAGLRARAVRGVNRALAKPAPVLVVAHGALFRALRQAAGLEANVRTPNALPLHMRPPAAGEAAWTITPAELAPRPAG